jgi:uncharacterized membrane protein YidH (DUF202 family)
MPPPGPAGASGPAGGPGSGPARDSGPGRAENLNSGRPRESGPGPARESGPGRARDFGPGRVEDFDPGLARERTRLAWTRTAVAFAAVGAAILKSHLVAGLAVLGLGGVVWGLRHLLQDTAVTRSQPARLLGVTLTVVAVAIVALVIAFVAHHQ